MIFPAAYERLASRISLASTGPGVFAFANVPGAAGGLALGAALGLIWTPCAGPVLGSILTLIATSKDTAASSALLVIYALGAAIPMLAIAYGGQAVTTRVRSIARFAPRLRQAFGAVVIAVAVATFLHYDTLIVAWVASFYPDGQIGL
jgi:cytochrome c-type biogenesis protein